MQVELVRKEREIDLQEKETQRRQKEYDANVKKKADADRYAIEQAAEAEKTKRLRVAEADAEQKRLQGIAAADAKKAEGTAEAEVIRLRGLAEAEAKEKLAEAFAKFGEAAVLEGMQHSFVVVPSLPDDVSNVEFTLAIKPFPEIPEMQTVKIPELEVVIK